MLDDNDKKNIETFSHDQLISYIEGLRKGSTLIIVSLAIFFNTTNDKQSLLKFKKIIDRRLRQIKKQDLEKTENDTK